eukprot:COSAG06_NODE_2519_length_6729_cov_5.857919_3_plen_1539_part_01
MEINPGKEGTIDGELEPHRVDPRSSNVTTDRGAGSLHSSTARPRSMKSTRHDAGGRRAIAVVWWALAASCSLKALTSHRGAAAAPVSAHGLSGDSGRRRAQGAALDQPLCVGFEQRGEQAELCGTSPGRELCPRMCAAAVATPPPGPPPLCAEFEPRGEQDELCGTSAGRELCPTVCADAGDGAVAGASTRADGAAVFQASCLVFLKLEGGCAHDLSHEDSALAPGTRVSDVCPADCSGHGKCAAAAVDISFLGSSDDSSGFGATVALHDGVCVDGGGATFDGGDDSWATIVPGLDYGNGAGFAIAFWLLSTAEEVWEPHMEFYPRTLYHHPPRSESSVAGGIDLSVSRVNWLDSWNMHASIAGTTADYELNLIVDAAPKWTHIVIKVEPSQIRVYEDGVQIHDSIGRGAVPRKYVGTMDLASDLFIGRSGGTHGWPPQSYNFRGSVAMLQLYASEASAELDIQCVFDGGKELVQNQRMAQDAPSECRGRISTGCTNKNADNFDPALPADAIDDGSCEFTQHEAVVGEHAVIHVTDDWQRVELSRSYINPIILCGVVTRDSTTEAVVRVRSVTTDPRTGTRYFEMRAEQKTCHSADPPPTSEHVDFIVVEAGVSVEGWQAGLTRVHNADWHRISFLQETAAGVQPVVVSQVQTYDNRTKFVSTRHHLPHANDLDPRLSSHLVGYWPFERGGEDLSGNQRHADTSAQQITGSPIAGGSFAMRFDGSGPATALSDGLPVAGSARTVMAWFKGCSGGIGALIAYGCMEFYKAFVLKSTQSCTRFTSDIYCNSGQAPGCGEFGDDEAFWFPDGDIYETEEWHHVAIAFDGSTMAGYHNGVQIKRGVPLSPPDTCPGSTFMIGGDEWNQHFTGVIDEVAVFDVAVTPTQMEAIYNNGLGLDLARTNTTVAPQQRHPAFFLKLQGEGVWCQDGQFFAEYFDSLDLSGSPHATQCETDVPSWHWHSISHEGDAEPGVPPILRGTTRTLAPELFSARWTARIKMDQGDEYIFSSHANRGSRIVVDGATILDSWEECCSTFSSEPLRLSAGVHIIVYEYRSGYTTNYRPTNSYAELSWSAAEGGTVGAVSGSNSTNITSTAEELFADVGWLACSPGSGALHTRSFQSGLTATDATLATTIVEFGSAFSVSPRIFAAVVSDADLSSHLRLTATALGQAAVAVEYDTCEAVFVSTVTSIGWIALAAPDGDSVRVAERQTLPTDSAALLSIGNTLQLPDYYHWRNSSDPCVDRWTGIECRRDASETPRIVVLDIHNVDLTNQEIPWRFIGQLTALEELALINLQVTGIIDGEYLCRLTSLQALILRQNQLRGTVPDCMATLPLQTLWLDDNKLHGPLPELSALGQFLKGLPSPSLLRNRWAPLLASEKAALEEVAGPLGIPTHPGGKDWDFAYSYEWERASGAPKDRLTAAREVSYRQWSGGVPFEGFYVELGFELPMCGDVQSLAYIGRDGTYTLGHVEGCSARSCSDLAAAYAGSQTNRNKRWPTTRGSPEVCGASDLLVPGMTCEQKPWDEALFTCQSIGARLCTGEE